MSAPAVPAPEAGLERRAVRYLLTLPGPRVVHVDSSATQVWGLPLAELRDFGRWLAGIHPADRPALEQLLARPAAGRHHLEYRVVHRAGTERWLCDSVFVWEDPRGTLLLGGHAVDVSRERAMQAQARFQAQLLDAVGETVVATDGVERVAYWNRAAEVMFQRPAAAVMGRPLSRAVRLVSGGADWATLLGQAARGGAWSGEVAVRGRGAELFVRLTLTVLTDGRGMPSGTVGVFTDLSERRRTEAELRRSREELRRLAAHARSVREEEQARIASEVHDQLGQMLTALRLDVASLRRCLSGEEPSVAEARERVGEISTMVDQTLGAMRRLAQRLRPVALDDLGLEAAAEALLREVARRAGFAPALRSRLSGMPADPERDTAAFRILQEALTNVARHAAAGRVEVRLAHRRGELLLQVSDDGRGLPVAAARNGGCGLLGMRERARALGGEVRWQRRAGGGTLVSARLPDVAPLPGSAAEPAGRAVPPAG